MPHLKRIPKKTRTLLFYLFIYFLIISPFPFFLLSFFSHSLSLSLFLFVDVYISVKFDKVLAANEDKSKEQKLAADLTVLLQLLLPTIMSSTFYIIVFPLQQSLFFSLLFFSIQRLEF